MSGISGRLGGPAVRTQGWVEKEDRETGCKYTGQPSTIKQTISEVIIKIRKTKDLES